MKGGMENYLDEVDLKIIRSLSENARKSYREIAKELHISLSTVANRIKRLEKEAVINGYLPIIDYNKIGYEYLAIIQVRISKGRLIDVQRKIGADPHAYEVYDVTGDWDSIILARFRTREELNNFREKLIAMDSVERMNTQIVLNVVKSERRTVV